VIKLNKKIVIGVLIGVIVVIGLIAIMGSFNNDSSGNSPVNLTNMTNNIAQSGEYYKGDVTGLLTVNKPLSYLYVTVTYYDDANTQMGQGYIVLTENNVKEGKKFNLQTEYYDTAKPKKAIIRVYDDMGTNLLKQEEININI